MHGQMVCYNNTSMRTVRACLRNFWMQKALISSGALEQKMAKHLKGTIWSDSTNVAECTLRVLPDFGDEQHDAVCVVNFIKNVVWKQGFNGLYCFKEVFCKSLC